MKITRRTVASGVATLAVLSATTVLAVPSAWAEPRPQHAGASEFTGETAPRPKAQVERAELLPPRTKAAIEHDESAARVPAADTSPADSGSALPWVVGGIVLLGVAGATVGSAALGRRQSPQQARPA